MGCGTSSSRSLAMVLALYVGRTRMSYVPGILLGREMCA